MHSLENADLLLCLAQLTSNKGILFANDANVERAKAIIGNIHRMGIVNCVVSTYDGRQLPKVKHTHPFNDPFSGTTRVSWYQKGKTNLDFTEPRDSEWQWNQLGHMQVCISLQTDNHASTPPLKGEALISVIDQASVINYCYELL